MSGIYSSNHKHAIIRFDRGLAITVYSDEKAVADGAIRNLLRIMDINEVVKWVKGQHDMLKLEAISHNRSESAYLREERKRAAKKASHP